MNITENYECSSRLSLNIQTNPINCEKIRSSEIRRVRGILRSSVSLLTSCLFFGLPRPKIDESPGFAFRLLLKPVEISELLQRLLG